MRIMSRLGSGGVGRTFKVEQVDPETGENFGTFVAKVMKSPESGRAALQAYQRVRSHTTPPSEPQQYRRYWHRARLQMRTSSPGEPRVTAVSLIMRYLLWIKMWERNLLLQAGRFEGLYLLRKIFQLQLKMMEC